MVSHQRQINDIFTENHHNAVRMIFLKLCQSMYWLSLALYTIYILSIYRVGLRPKLKLSLPFTDLPENIPPTQNILLEKSILVFFSGYDRSSYSFLLHTQISFPI